MAIDLAKLNSVRIDKAAATVTVGPGVHFGEIFDPIYQAGFELRMFPPILTQPSSKPVINNVDQKPEQQLAQG